jgi:hypothetical protein
VSSPGNMLVQGHIVAHEFLGLSTVFNSLNGSFSLLREPSFDLNKKHHWSSFFSRVFQGSIPKNIGVYMCLIWFHFLYFHFMFS